MSARRKTHVPLFLGRLLAAAAVLPLVACAASTFAASAAAEVPSLDQLAADWIEVKTLRNFPATYNYWGGLMSTPNLASFESLFFPPYTQGGSAGELAVDGVALAATQSRWFPYQVVRRAVRDGVMFESSIRLPFEQRGILCRLTLANQASASRSLKLTLALPGRVRRFEITTPWLNAWGGRMTGWNDYAPPRAGRQLRGVRIARTKSARRARQAESRGNCICLSPGAQSPFRGGRKGHCGVEHCLGPGRRRNDRICRRDRRRCGSRRGVRPRLDRGV